MVGSFIYGRTGLRLIHMKSSYSMQPSGMVVDDDALVRETVAEVLEDLCDHVYQASNGEEGLEVLREHPDISVVVTDIAMPRLDGVAFASRARRCIRNSRCCSSAGCSVRLRRKSP
jgi:response regulator RpfG family c-di-GMP phosphodiesterase